MANRPPTNPNFSNMMGTQLRGEAAPTVTQHAAPILYSYPAPHIYHPMVPMMMQGQVVQNVYQSTGSIYTAQVTPNYVGLQQQQQQRRQQPQQGSQQWYEEQQRLRERYAKERNYQIQQQRLREFQSSGSQLLNAEHLIQNMFGRSDDGRKVAASHNNVLENHRSEDERRELRPIQKARDWSQLDDLRDVFEVTSEELPPWCQEGALVPKLYTDVERYVTDARSGIIDTSLLYPVLLSSGLSRENLGHIWTLANRKTLGQLTKSELYAILALVALAQNACQITSLSILNTLHQAPVPLLNQTTNPVQSGIQETVHQVVTQTSTDDEFDDFQSASSGSDLRITDATLEGNVGSRLANHGLVHTQNNSGTQNVIESDSTLDFADFQQASSKEHRSLISNASDEFTNVPRSVSESLVTTKLDLMSNDEDKYSVFRTLEAPDSRESDDFGDFLSSDIPFSSINPIETTSASSTTSSSATDFATSTSSNCQNKTKDSEGDESTDDDFEFMSYVSRKPSSDLVDPGTYVVSSPVVECPQSDNDDFGDFVAPGETSNVNNCDSISIKGTSSFPDALDGLSLNFDFLKIKDRSSVESQSVSSLDFGTHLENNLSRCGSIPSLDFKVGSDNDQESRDSSPSCVLNTVSTNGFGGSNSSPSSVETTTINIPSSPLNGPPNPPPPSLLDRYSVIRNDAPKECEWQRCLDSCYELIRNALNIFNGISSSAVCKEVIGSEEGGNYLQNIIEVYRISLRIATSYKVSQLELIESKIEATIGDINEEWNNLSSFIVGSHIFPDEPSLDFASLILNFNDDQNVQKACGVCLLEVKERSSATFDTQDKLVYGGRLYHAACANFWVNYVDSLLPALTFPKRQFS